MSSRLLPGPASNAAQPADGLPHPRTIADVIAWLEAAGVIEGAIREGEMVPDFELINAAGHAVSVQTLLDRGPAVITFTLGCRSPLCRCSLVDLQTGLAEFMALGASVVALTPDPPAVSREIALELSLGFDLLDDRAGRLAALFGIAYRPPMATEDWLALLGLDAPTAWPARDLPLPAAFVVTSDGIVQMAFVQPDPRARVSRARLVAVLAALPGRPPQPTL
jgi:peroxiredoxin